MEDIQMKDEVEEVTETIETVDTTARERRAKETDFKNGYVGKGA